MLTIVLTVIAALGGLSGVAAFISARSAARKNDVESLDLIIKNLRQEITSLESRYAVLEQKYDRLQRQYEHVLAWAEARGYCPPEGG